MIANWDPETVAIDKVIFSNKEASDVLFMKLTKKKLTYKDVVTEYFSSNLSTLLSDHINSVVKNSLSKPYIVPKVDYPPPLYSRLCLR